MKRLFNIKYVVVISYIILFLIAIWGLSLLYQKFLDFSEVNSFEKERSELMLVGNTLSMLYDVENDKSLFNKDLSAIYYDKYDAVMPKVFANLDSLKELSSDIVRIAKLDTIGVLLNEKRQNLIEITTLLDSIEKAPRVTRSIVHSTVPRSLNKDIRQYLSEKNQSPFQSKQEEDSVIVKKKQKGFLGRLKDVFNPDESADSTIIINQTSFIQSKEFIPVVDTVINMVRYFEKLDLQRQKQLQVILMNRQAEMGKTNSSLTNRIDELLKSIEKEELGKTLFILDYKNKSINSAKRVLFIAAILLIVIAFVFGAIFIRDMLRKQRYRMQLEASNAKINELLRIREKMMYAISHDIKSPLNSILGYIELMNPHAASQETALYLDNMKQSGQHVLQLVTNLLDYHKLESKKWVLKELNYNLFDLLKNITNSFTPIAKEKGLRCNCKNVIPEGFVCYGDPFVLRQIISNLLSNAIKFTFSGQITTLAKLSEHNDMWQFDFSVIDTGIGISEAQKKLIFKEFGQLKEDGTELIEGSGLGLVITKSLIEELGGTLHLKSEKGTGSIFSFTIPLKKEIDEKMDRDVSSLAQFDLSGVSVLVIDDDELQLQMTEEMLLQKRADVTTTSHPENVLNMLASKLFDLLFIDIQMPDINGFELVSRIRESAVENSKTIPIIALSAKSDVEESDMQHSGFTAFLAKPFSMSQLFDSIAAVLNLEHKVVQPEMKNNTPTIRNLIEYVKEDVDASREIIVSFAQNSEKEIHLLREQIEQHRWADAAKTAHKMLPLIKMIGDDEAVFVLSKLEIKSAVSSQEITELFVSLQGYLDEAYAFLTNN